MRLSAVPWLLAAISTVLTSVGAEGQLAAGEPYREQIEQSFSFAEGGAPAVGAGQRPGAAAGTPASPAPSGRAALGVMVRDLTPAEAQALGIREPRGGLVEAVVPGSAAEKAGLQRGDVIVVADRRSLDQAADLVQIVAGRNHGGVIELTVLRGGAQQTYRITLGSAPGASATAPPAPGTVPPPRPQPEAQPAPPGPRTAVPAPGSVLVQRELESELGPE